MSLREPDGLFRRSAENDLLQLLACEEVNVVFLGADLRIRLMASATARLLGVEPAASPPGLKELADRLQCPELLVDARQSLERGEAMSRNLHLPEREKHLALRF